MEIDVTEIVKILAPILFIFLLFYGEDLLKIFQGKRECKHRWKKLAEDIVTCEKCGEIKKL